jgi:leucyl aminopeptidase
LRLDAFRQALGTAVKRVRQAKVSSFGVVMPGAILEELPVQDVAQALAEGAILGSYQFTAYRSPNGSKPVDVERLTIYTAQASLLAQITEGIRRGVATAEATVLVRDLCNHPANVMTPTRIVQEAKAVTVLPKGVEQGIVMDARQAVDRVQPVGDQRLDERICCAVLFHDDLRTIYLTC